MHVCKKPVIKKEQTNSNWLINVNPLFPYWQMLIITNTCLNYQKEQCRWCKSIQPNTTGGYLYKEQIGFSIVFITKE